MFIPYFTDEGRKKIFHRDEIKKFNANRPEEKKVAEFGANNKNGNSNYSQESKLNNIMHHFGFPASYRNQVETIISENDFDTAADLVAELHCEINGFPEPKQS